jgi:nucleotide-binding universal stress UspA family protein
MSEGSNLIVCCTDASGRFDTVRTVAVDKAKDSGARVIFYDVSDTGTMTDPRPNIWAGEGEAEQYNHPLDPVALEKLGRHDLAVQVMHAREQSVDAYGWLPNEPGGKALLDYARRENADLILLPADDETMARYVGELREVAAEGSSPLASTVRLVDADAHVRKL